MKKFGLPIVVALNMFPADTAEEKKVIEDACQKVGVAVAESMYLQKAAKAVWIWLKKSSPPLIRAPTITHSMIWKAA